MANSKYLLDGIINPRRFIYAYLNKSNEFFKWINMPKVYFRIPKEIAGFRRAALTKDSNKNPNLFLIYNELGQVKDHYNLRASGLGDIPAYESHVQALQKFLKIVDDTPLADLQLVKYGFYDYIDTKITSAHQLNQNGAYIFFGIMHGHIRDLNLTDLKKMSLADQNNFFKKHSVAVYDLNSRNTSWLRKYGFKFFDES